MDLWKVICSLRKNKSTTQQYKRKYVQVVFVFTFDLQLALVYGEKCFLCFQKAYNKVTTRNLAPWTMGKTAMQS